jgi:hypothetical protein
VELSSAVSVSRYHVKIANSEFRDVAPLEEDAILGNRGQI